MHYAGRMIALAVLTSWLIACSDTESKPPLSKSNPSVSKKIEVLDEGFGFRIEKVKKVESSLNENSEQTVSITIGSSRQNTFTLNLLRSNVKKGYRAQSKKLDNPEVVLSALWHGDRYVQSGTHDTVVNLKIRSVTPKTAVILFSGTLVNPATGGYLKINESMLRVEGDDLKELVYGQPFDMQDDT